MNLTETCCQQVFFISSRCSFPFSISTRCHGGWEHLLGFIIPPPTGFNTQRWKRTKPRRQQRGGETASVNMPEISLPPLFFLYIYICLFLYTTCLEMPFLQGKQVTTWKVKNKLFNYRPNGIKYNYRKRNRLSVKSFINRKTMTNIISKYNKMSREIYFMEKSVVYMDCKKTKIRIRN